MKNFLIVPIPKSPHMDSFRFGPVSWQDWHVGLMMAIRLNRILEGSQIAVITDFADKNGSHEADIYSQILKDNAVNDHFIFKEGFETVGQVEAANRIAKEKGLNLVIISTFLHRPRIGYYAGQGVLHETAWGIPNLKEVFRDIIMIPLAPIIRNCGWEKKFVEIVTTRREKGKL